MHQLLQRQLERLGLTEILPNAQQWHQFLETVSYSYTLADEDREQLQRTLELSSGEMKELNCLLREERDRLQAVFNAVPAGVIQVDATGRVVLMNPLAEDLLWTNQAVSFGKPIDEIVVFESVSEKSVPEIYSVLAALAGHDLAVKREVYAKPVDGEPFYGDVAITKLQDLGGVAGGVLILREKMPLAKAA